MCPCRYVRTYAWLGRFKFRSSFEDSIHVNAGSKEDSVHVHAGSRFYAQIAQNNFQLYLRKTPVEKEQGANTVFWQVSIGWIFINDASQYAKVCTDNAKQHSQTFAHAYIAVSEEYTFSILVSPGHNPRSNAQPTFLLIVKNQPTC